MLQPSAMQLPGTSLYSTHTPDKGSDTGTIGLDHQNSPTTTYQTYADNHFAVGITRRLIHDIDKSCCCISCLTKALITRYQVGDKSCLLECGSNLVSYYTRYFYPDQVKHFKSHFQGENKRFSCNIPGCKTTFLRWSELKRRSKSHCRHAQRFPCDVFGCRYGGSNGFSRRDKLLNRKRNVHEGKAAPNQAMRKLEPKSSQMDAQPGPSTALSGQ